MQEHKSGMRASLERRLFQAQANGQLAADKSPEIITSLIMIFMDGLATQATGPMEVEEAHELLNDQLDALL